MEKIRVIITNDQKAIKIPTGIRMLIRRCCHAVLRMEGFTDAAEISVTFVDNEQIRELNAQYRNKDSATDVLSFPMFQLEPGCAPEDWTDYLDMETGMCPLGDMCISLERAVAQAKEFGHSVKREVGYLTIHSMLHLLGYDHLDEGPQKKQMRGREEAIAATIRGLRRD